MQVVVINGSPRPQGNTAHLLQVAVQELQQRYPEVKTTRVDLNDLDFQGCQGCLACKTEDSTGCMLQDELTPVLEQLAAADMWLLGSPIYMAHVSGQFKLWLDRLYGFTGPNRTMRLTPGKRALVILTQGVRDITTYSDVTDLLQMMFDRRGFATVESVIAASPKGAETTFSDAVLQEVREKAARLVC